MNIGEVVNSKFAVAKRASELKLWLSQKASVEYFNYINNGGNARTAKEKVLDELKMKEENTLWLQKEQDYEQARIIYTYLVDCLNVANNLLSAGELYTETLNEFLNIINIPQEAL